MTITTIDRATCQELRIALEQTLARLEEEHGIRVSVGRGTFNAHNASFKIELATCGEDGEANTKEATAFARCCWKYDLEADDLGKSFETGFKRYTIIGANPQAPKFPILARCEQDGKTYRFAASNVRWLLAKDAREVDGE